MSQTDLLLWHRGTVAARADFSQFGLYSLFKPLWCRAGIGTLLLSAILKKLSIYTKPRVLMKQYVTDSGWMGMLC